MITYWYNTKNTDKKSYTELNTFDDSSFRTAFLLPLAGYRKYKDSEIGSNSQ
ncbi:hypothetical protein J6V86_00630 [bacterium]|nr:hypothetical protein [bacterium]